MKRNLLPLLIAVTPAFALAHGWVSYPKARQAICHDDGGYWSPADGSAIPNGACRAAFLQSGTYPFTQLNEFSANVADYRDLGAVQQRVVDGSLCSAGDSAKAGMDLPSAAWQKTTLQAGQSLEWLFRATATHNPSYWQFYLTKPGFDTASQVLTWADLQLLDTADNLQPVTIGGNNYYQLTLTLPAERSGDAILYTRWQRDDAAGEGFYNCSDIHINGADSTPVWHDGGYLLSGDPGAASGDNLWFRVFDGSGSELVFETLAIDDANQSLALWTAALATQVNGADSQWVQLGIKDGDSIVFDASQPLANKVWLADSRYSSALDLKKGSSDAALAISGLAQSYQVGDTLALELSADGAWQGLLVLAKDGGTLAQWPLSLSAGQSQTIGYPLSEAGDYSLTFTATAGQSQQLGFAVSAISQGGDYDYLYPAGLGGYQAGTLVLGSDGNRYQCKPYPYSGWCNQAASYYAPGTGSAWQDAWLAL